MVCDRCIIVLRNVLDRLHLHPIDIQLGEVSFTQAISISQKSALAAALQPLGFELYDDKRHRLIERIKSFIIERIQAAELSNNAKLSVQLSQLLHHDYNYLSGIFSESENTTIEKYYIAQKIEKVKELILYDELSMSEIAHKLHYSSVAYLSNQFKKVVGITPSEFKNQQIKKRIPLDKV